MTVIRPIIGWHQKCWVWLACQMGNSRRTAEASYSRSYGPTDSVRGLYGSLSSFLFLPSTPRGMIWTCTVRKLPDDVSGNRRKIISPCRNSTIFCQSDFARARVARHERTEPRRNCNNPVEFRTLGYRFLKLRLNIRVTRRNGGY